eukprot:m.127057 g.127057  ORF g.127057 m.127057 type:complete len:359 (-) comp52250_c0_seq8:73-1149(-)
MALPGAKWPPSDGAHSEHSFSSALKDSRKPTGANAKPEPRSYAALASSATPKPAAQPSATKGRLVYGALSSASRQPPPAGTAAVAVPAANKGKLILTSARHTVPVQPAQETSQPRRPKPLLTSVSVEPTPVDNTRSVGSSPTRGSAISSTDGPVRAPTDTGSTEEASKPEPSATTVNVLTSVRDNLAFLALHEHHAPLHSALLAPSNDEIDFFAPAKRRTTGSQSAATNAAPSAAGDGARDASSALPQASESGKASLSIDINRPQQAEPCLLSSSMEAEDRLLRSMGWTNETPVERLTEAEIREFQQRISSAREKHPKTGAAALKPAGPLLSDLDESEDSSLDSSDDDADDSLFSLKP